MEYELIRSNRRTIGAEIKEGRLIIRAPKRASRREIEAFIAKHTEWIEKNLARAKARQREMESIRKLTPEEMKKLAKEASEVIPARVAYYAPLIGVDYGRVTIRSQKSRWGSCSAKGNLNFNCLLMLAPPEVLDSVVVHELCHRKEMNHSPNFYAEVYRVFPEYKKWHRWLKEHGNNLMAMRPDAVI